MKRVLFQIRLLDHIYGDSLWKLNELKICVLIEIYCLHSGNYLLVNEMDMLKYINARSCWLSCDILTSYSYDSVDVDDEGDHINEELLNRLELTGFSPHCLQLERNIVVILIRNVDSQQGLCNETRCLVLGMETKCWN